MNNNIVINYLYRDAGNYKLYGSKVFSNSANLSLDTIRQNIENKLIDGLYFVPEKWGIDRLMFDEFDEEEDHAWHEIESIELSTKDVESISDIGKLLLNLEMEK